MSPSPEPLIAALPSLSPRLAAARDRILEVLSFPADGLTLKPAVVEDAPGGPWVVFDTATGRVALVEVGAEIGAEIGEGATPRDHAETLARLDRLEPLLAALETSGLDFDPVDVAAASDADIHVRVEAFDVEGGPRHAVVLALDIAVAEAWPQTARPAPDLSTLAAPLPARLVLDGPAVPAGAGLGVGDIVLLPPGADREWRATLVVAGRRARGVFSSARGGFSVTSLEPIPMSDLAASVTVDPAPDPAAAAALADLPVTLRVALGEVSLTAGQLAGLRPGATVTLDVPPGEARAVLLAGERAVASGRLVALGEAYGLVIDKVGAEA